MGNEILIKETLDDMREKYGELDDIKRSVRKMGAKIEDIQMIEVDDVRDTAKTAKEAKEAVERLEASFDGISTKVRSEIKNVLDTAPNVERQKQTPPEQWLDMAKMSQEDFADHCIGRPSEALGQPEGTVFRTSFLSPYEIQKAAGAATTHVLDPSGPSSTDTANLQGGITTDVKFWHKAIIGDPWVQAGAFQMPINAGSFKTLEASGIAFDATAAAPTNAAFDTVSGKVQETSHAAKTHTMRVLVSHNQEDDVQGITNYLLMMIQLAYGKSRGALTTAAVKAGGSSDNNTTSGNKADRFHGGNAGSNKLDIYAEMLEMPSRGTLPNYWPMGGAFVMHPELLSYLLIRMAVKQVAYDMPPSIRMRNVAGWDVIPNTQVDSQAVSAIPLYWGSWRMALLQAQVGRLTVDRYTATVPGAMAIYAQFRFLPVIMNPDAYGKFIIKT